jgi:hypothetical protein
MSIKIKPPSAKAIATMRIQPFFRICPIKAILLQLFENQFFNLKNQVASEKAGAKVKVRGRKKEEF